MGQGLSSRSVKSWSRECQNLTIAEFNRTCDLNVGFVDRFGNPWHYQGTTCPTFSSALEVQDQQIWGINKTTCDQFCGPNVIYQQFVFTDFASSSANWLLPWLALSAQLPYEGAGLRDNAMAFFLGVGSPCLLAYSISLTALNRLHIRRRFQKLIVQRARRINASIPFMEERLQAACELLQEAQQCPLRLSNEAGWLSSLILLSNNTRFWRSTTKYLHTTRRRTTPSLIAQLLLAIITYFFTFFAVSTDPESQGSTSVGLSLAFSSGWTWMLSIMMGVVFIGSQLKVGAVRDALDEEEVDDNNYSSFRAIGCGVFERGLQNGIRSRSGLNNLVRWKADRGSRESSKNGSNGYPPLGQLSPPAVPQTSSSAAHASLSGSCPALRPRAASSDTTSSSPSPLTVPGGAAAQQPAQTHCSSTQISNDNQGYTLASSERPPVLQANGVISAESQTQAQSHANDQPFEFYHAPKVPKLVFWEIEGDEQKEGPIYNYARVFTQAQTLRQLEHGFAAMLRNLNAGSNAPPVTVSGLPFDYDPKPSLDEALSGTTEEMAVFTDLPPESEDHVPYMMAAYVGWRQMDPDLLLHIVVSSVTGVAILWTAVGAGIYISYDTPYYGLGCRSGALLLYGLLATISWWLLLASSILSHDTMREYQRIFRNSPGKISRSVYKEDPWGALDKTLAMRSRRAAVVLTRTLGKMTAAANACWLIIACIMELSGYFEQCWCQTNALSGSNGNALVFVTQTDLGHVASKVWLNGFLWSLVVPVVAALGYATLSHKAGA